MKRSGPLSNIRILDLSQTLAGPFASTILGDLGAEIIKVEKPGYGDQTRHFSPYLNGESHYFLSINRNKKSIEINLKSEAGKKVFLNLVQKSDIILENFSPNTLEKIGIGKKEILKTNPDIIYCSITAFGETGSFGNKKGYDVVIQALSGVMSLTGEENNPLRAGIPIGDLVGGLYGAISILGAIIEKNRTGKSLIVDLSLLDSLVSLLGYFSGKYFITGESEKPIGSHHPFIVPYGTFKAADRHMVISIYTEKFWENFVIAIDRREWLTDYRFKHNEDRVRHKEILIKLINDVLKTHTVSEWSEIFEKHDIPHAPILNVGEALNHPQVWERGLIKKVEHPEYGSIKYVGSPIRYSNKALENDLPPPKLGEHTKEVLKEVLGYSNEEIDNLLTQQYI